MHNVHTSHIFIMCNSVICTNTFNILALFYNCRITLNYTVHFVYSPLNVFYIHWIFDFKYILLLLIKFKSEQIFSTIIDLITWELPHILLYLNNKKR